MDTESSKYDGADADPDASKKKSMVGNGSAPVSPAPTSAKRQLMLTYAGQTLSPSATAKQDLKRSDSKNKGTTSLANSGEERHLEK